MRHLSGGSVFIFTTETELTRWKLT